MSRKITFDQWLALACEYAKVMYLWDWDEPITDQEKAAYDSGVSPKEYIDGLAEQYGLDSYPSWNFGHIPPGYAASKYEVRP